MKKSQAPTPFERRNTRSGEIGRLGEKGIYVGLFVPDNLFGKLALFKAQQEISQSEAVRRLVTQALDSACEEEMMHTLVRMAKQKWNDLRGGKVSKRLFVKGLQHSLKRHNVPIEYIDIISQKFSEETKR